MTQFPIDQKSGLENAFPAASFILVFPVPFHLKAPEAYR